MKLSTTLLPLAFAFTSAAAGAGLKEAHPNDTPVLYQPYPVYTDQKTSAHLGSPALQSISRIAGQPVLILTPDLLGDYPDWKSHPFLKPLRKISDKDTMSNFHALGLYIFTAPSGFFLTINFNHDKKREGQGCAIAATTDLNVKETLREVAGAPDTFRTEDFIRLFDRNSLVTFSLLHEAAHCKHKQNNVTSHDDAEELRFEMDADAIAAKAYRELQKNDDRLDPRMPEKIMALRVLSPILRTTLAEDGFLPGTLQLVFAPHGHSTGNVTESGTGYDRALHTRNVVENYRILTLLALSAAKTKAPLDLSQMDKIASLPGIERTDIANTGLLPVRYGRGNNPAGKTIGRLVDGAFEAARDPTQIYTVAHLIANGVLTAEGNKYAADLRGYGRDVLNAWDTLGFPLPSDEAVKEFSARLLPLAERLETADKNSPAGVFPAQAIKSPDGKNDLHLSGLHPQ